MSLGEARLMGDHVSQTEEKAQLVRRLEVSPLSLMIATPLTVTFTCLGIQSAPYGALQMVWWFLAVINAVLTCGILMLTSFRIGR